MGKPNVSITNGKDGGIVIPDGNTNTITFDPPATILKALGGDVVFDTVAGNLRQPDGSDGGLNGQTLSNGDSLPGRFTSIKLTSGTLVCYA